MPKRTHQPKVHRKHKRSGFLKRMSSKSGRAVLKSRRNKGRKKISH